MGLRPRVEFPYLILQSRRVGLEAWSQSGKWHITIEKGSNFKSNSSQVQSQQQASTELFCTTIQYNRHDAKRLNERE